jgi:hypothetical protein
MVLRQAPKGANAGSAILGVRALPRMPGTRAAGRYGCPGCGQKWKHAVISDVPFGPLSRPMKPGPSSEDFRRRGSSSYPSCAASAAAHSTSMRRRPFFAHGLGALRDSRAVVRVHPPNVSPVKPSSFRRIRSSTPFRGRPRGRGALRLSPAPPAPPPGRAPATPRRRAASPSRSPAAAWPWPPPRSSAWSCSPGTRARRSPEGAG